MTTRSSSVRSILAGLSAWSGSLYGASPLNPSGGHGGGLGSCTSGQSWVGHRWAKEEGLGSIQPRIAKTLTVVMFSCDCSTWCLLFVRVPQ